ncbi:hypothetical protein CC1G_05099 [Coprinopsis cinerea okayama7|uniref:Mitochondrial carrier protein n=1 Tax=Coprinopsis cinerea (strain Okayama-7 / 130 / ATCC MYA-4618 / FGSC 9003) TaxID=240176 RepID=A8NGB8_COPC7|nr:hypothetical protein CC1G_05099 [Coprinopsis cinerea okayama7\|eukprot:XP_001833399.2 hypothetical protein CC1G_05099 [Coprinopsis cinerea okayama7\
MLNELYPNRKQRPCFRGYGRCRSISYEGTGPVFFSSGATIQASERLDTLCWPMSTCDRASQPSEPVTGWQFLRNIASQEGASLTPNYVLTMCKTQGVWVVPKHFLPPILLNAALGTVLWTSYGLANEAITERFGDDHPIRTAALAGGFAGGCQALVAAPAENVRLLLEGGSGGHSWSCVWKEVFRSRVSPPSLSHHQQLQEIRELRHWLHEVGEMAGRGWDGWKWGCGKDICAFFTVFEMTRRTSLGWTCL